MLSLAGLFTLLTPSSPMAQQSKQEEPLTVLYTGMLYGYLRVDTCQDLTAKQDPADITFPACFDPSKLSPVDLAKRNQDANAVSCFFQELKNQRDHTHPILVGMGDNFGPRLEARMEKDATTANQALWWKPRSKNPDRLADPVLEIVKDPVACFLRAARYDAIVPGREDFNLGPERIRNIAEFLNDPKAFSRGGSGVPVLGANLVFNVHYKDPGDPIPEDRKKLDFNSFSSALPQFNMLTSEPFLPTLRNLEFRVTLGVEPGSNVSRKVPALAPAPKSIKPVSLDVNPAYLFSSLKSEGHVALCGPYRDLDALNKPGQCIWLEMPEIYKTKTKEWVRLDNNQNPADPKNPDLTQQLDECSSSIRDAARDSGKSLLEIRTTSLPRTREKCTLVKDYLSGGDIDVAKAVVPSVRLRWHVIASGSSGPRADLTPDQSYRFCLWTDQASLGIACQRLPIRRPIFPLPYARVKGQDVVIFGVVDPNFRAQLTDTQGSWLEDEKKDLGRKVEIESVDPRSAIIQAEDAFQSSLSDADKKKKFRKILLAQMDSHAAEDLAATLEGPYAVDLTIARADLLHPTPAGETVILPQTKAKNLPVLVPSPISNGDGKDLLNPLSIVSLSRSAGHITLSTTPAVLFSSNNVPFSLDKLKYFPVSETQEGYYIGLNCPLPSSLPKTLPKTEEEMKKMPKMLGLLRCAAKDYLLQIAEHEKVPASSYVPSAGSEFTEAVLQIMRQRSHSDLGLLESRELYGVIESSNQEGDPDQPDPNDRRYLRKFIDRILWEDATIQKLTITGATLKKILKQSATYSNQEESSTERAAVLGRALKFSGLTKGPGKEEYFVNGKALEDTTQYSVAVSDRLLSVDSDYPDLRKDLAGNTAEILWYKAEYMSFAVCEELVHAYEYFGNVSCSPGNPTTQNAAYQQPGRALFAAPPECECKDKECENKMALARLLQGPPSNPWCAPAKDRKTANMIDPNPGMRLITKFLDSFALPSFHPAPAGPLDLPRGHAASLQSASELADQFQRTRRFQISELSLAFSTHNPDQNAQQLSNTFSSAVLSTVNQARSSTWDVKNTARFTIGHYGFLGHGLDAYASDDIAFSSQDQDQTGAFPHKITLNKNQWAVVPYGLSWSFSRNLPEFFHRKPDRLLPDINLVLEPSRLSGQFIGTDNFITVSQATTSGTCNGTLKNGICSFSVDPVQQPTLSYSPRLGIRLESLSSYFEFGSQNSRDWRIPVQYIFNANSAAPIPCSADQLQSCVLANSTLIDPALPIQQINTARWQSAFYVDSVYKFPVPKIKKMFYVLKNKGEYYWNNHFDTQVLTKYDYTMTNSLSIPVFRNISLEPTAELFWYENKIALNDLFKRSYSIKLNYTIDWGIQRVKFREASKQTPFAQPSTGTSK
jgi:hypothetical protein